MSRLDVDVGFDSSKKVSVFSFKGLIPLAIVFFVLVLVVLFFVFGGVDLDIFSGVEDNGGVGEGGLFDHGPVECFVVDVISSERKVLVFSTGESEDDFLESLNVMYGGVLVYWDGRFVRTIPGYFSSGLRELVVVERVDSLYFYLEDDEFFDVEKEMVESMLYGLDVNCFVIQNNVVPVKNLLDFN